MNPKYAIIIPDGAADEPLEELGGKTPLDVANIPNMHAIAGQGRLGRVHTVPKGFVAGSDIATLSLLGYDATKYYSGRAPIEAVSRNIQMGPNDVAFRCNLVTIINGEMSDPTAGHIRPNEAAQIIASLNEAFADDPQVKFYTGVSYRNLLVISDPSMLDVSCMPPHDIPQEAVAPYMPKGKAAARIRGIMRKARDVVLHHDVNAVRGDLGETPATDIWLWGQGVVPIMPRFRQCFGVRGSVIAAVDLMRGLGKLLGWPIIEVDGVTGYVDTNYAGKGQAAVDAFDEFDLLTVHIEAPDEAGHMGDAALKVESLEKIDEHVVGPVLEKLRSYPDWRILVSPDHSTPVSLKTHTADAVPFCMAGTNVSGIVTLDRYTEEMAAKSDLRIQKGHELMEYFLRR